jgi:hypothetical protein
MQLAKLQKTNEMNEMNMTQNQLGTILIFAARYAHNRPTGAALAVCRAIENEWKNLSASDQMQLIRESHAATCNDDDWQIIRRLPIPATQESRQERSESAEGDNSQTGATMP